MAVLIMNLIIFQDSNNDKKISISLEHLDPTVVLRLHSIISGKDIFTLKKLYDYQIKRISETDATMVLPQDMILKISAVSSKKTILNLWYSSIEVCLNKWTLKEAKKNYREIIAFCNP